MPSVGDAMLKVPPDCGLYRLNAVPQAQSLATITLGVRLWISATLMNYGVSQIMSKTGVYGCANDCPRSTARRSSTVLVV